jgi:peptidoglycan/xylan/chitin deacetylase (PgdA/CDA1 family)
MLFPVRPPLLIRKFYNRFTWKMEGVGNFVYLTFDDGPAPKYTEFVLDTLYQFKAKATFFCIGQNAEKNPGIYQRIISEGHSTGNHTWQHLNGWLTPKHEYISDVRRTEELIAPGLFRPPYGRIRMEQAEDIMQRHRIIMWDVLSYDYHPKVSPEKCYTNVIHHTRPGSIVVFHDSEKAFPKLEPVLPMYLKFLIDQGYKFATL